MKKRYDLNWAMKTSGWVCTPTPLQETWHLRGLQRPLLLYKYFLNKLLLQDLLFSNVTEVDVRENNKNRMLRTVPFRKKISAKLLRKKKLPENRVICIQPSWKRSGKMGEMENSRETTPFSSGTPLAATSVYFDFNAVLETAQHKAQKQTQTTGPSLTRLSL